MVLTFSKEIYPKFALIKAAYNFTDRAYLHLDAVGDHYAVELTPKQGCENISNEEFTNEMLCQCVRHTVYEQTEVVRELLTARAMASTVIGQPDISDIASEPASIAASEQEILTDWFEKYDDSDTE